MEKNRANGYKQVLFDETIPQEKENGHIVEANGEMKHETREGNCI